MMLNMLIGNRNETKTGENANVEPVALVAMPAR